MDIVPNSLSSDRYLDSAFQEAPGTLGMRSVSYFCPFIKKSQQLGQILLILIFNISSHENQCS
jgi:hypothetical protein